MRDDSEYWDALSTRIVDHVREQREASWSRAAVWAPALVTAAALLLLLADRGAPVVAPNRAPSIAVMLTASGQAPSIVAMLREQP